MKKSKRRSNRKPKKLRGGNNDSVLYVHFLAMLAGLRNGLLLYDGEDGYDELDLFVHISIDNRIKPYVTEIAKRFGLKAQKFFIMKKDNLLLVFPESSQILVESFDNPFSDNALTKILSFPCLLTNDSMKYVFDIYYKDTSILTYLCSNYNNGASYANLFVERMNTFFKSNDLFFVKVKLKL